MNIKNLATASATAVLLSACAASGSPFGSLTAPDNGQSRLYVYRTSSIKGSGIRFTVNAGNTPIGVIRNGGYLVADLPPGEHEISAKTEVRRSVTLPFKPNEIQCVKASVGFGAFVGRPKLEAVSLEQCRNEIAGTKASI